MLLSMLERDYMMRIVKQLAKFLEKILFLKNQHRYEDALDTWDQALDELFGPDAQLLNKLNTQSAANFLVHPEKILAYAKMLNAQAGIFESLDEHRLAVKRSQRCLDILSIWNKSRSGAQPEDVESLQNEAQMRRSQCASVMENAKRS